MHFGIIQEEEIVLIEFAARLVRERCGSAAPGAPHRVGSRGERSTESCIGDDSSQANRGAS